MHPAQPAPESLAPRKPGLASAASTSASRACELFSKSSRLEAWEAETRRPNFNRSSALEQTGALPHPIVFSKHMPGALAADRIKPIPMTGQILKAHVAERPDDIGPALFLEVRHDRLALGATAVVHAIGQPPRRFRIADNDGRAGLSQG